MIYFSLEDYKKSLFIDDKNLTNINSVLVNESECSISFKIDLNVVEVIEINRGLARKLINLTEIDLYFIEGMRYSSLGKIDINIY